MAEQDGVFNLTEAVPMFHPNLLKAKAFKGRNGQEQGEPKFSANLGFKPDSADLRDIMTLSAKLARARWPGRALSELAKPWTDGTALADKAKAKVDAFIAGGSQGKAPKLAEYNRGLSIITARSKFRPRLALISGSRIVDLEDEAVAANIGKFFFGAEVLAQLNFCTYEGVGNNPDGINVYVNMLMATGKGTRIGGGTPASEVFRHYVGHASGEDPTQNTNEQGGW